MLYSITLLGFSLQQNYTVSDTTVYSTDLVKECDRKFFILQIPHNQTKYQHPSFEIVKTFKQFGCEVDPVEFGRIEFTLLTQTKCLKTDLESFFLSKYPTLQIQNIYIKYNKFFDCKEPYSIDSIPNAKSGSMIVSQGGKRHFFRYDVDAKIKRYVSLTDIKKGDELNLSNTDYKYIAFEDLHKKYINRLDNYVAKYNILRDKEITHYMVKPKPAVVQNKTVKCRYKQGNIVIEFEATPLSDGIVGQEIRVRRGFENYKAKVIGKNLVEIL